MVYADLNMVRAGVVNHPFELNEAEAKYGGVESDQPELFDDNSIPWALDETLKPHLGA
jgi:hypothetical protein